MQKCQKKLEMRGRAQREATRRCASDWGHNLGKGQVKIPLVATSRVPNISGYTARPVLTVGGSTCAPTTFLLLDRKGEGRKGKGRKGKGGREWERRGGEGTATGSGEIL